MRFKKIYIEITNSCNFNCSYCFHSQRPAIFISPDRFQLIIDKIKSYTNYIYLHVLGEPFLHPQLDTLLTIATKAKLNVNITTNGSLLNRKKELLLRHHVRQVNISLHDAEENIPQENWKNFLQSCFLFAGEVSQHTYVCFRLWNTTNETSTSFNTFCFTEMADYFKTEPNNLKENTVGNGIKLADHIFLQKAPRFEWPDNDREGGQVDKSCYGLRDQIAILAGGEIVPCCLDADANLQLGNIFTDDLSVILKSERAMQIKKGFEQHKAIEPFCQTCGFRSPNL